MSCRRDREPQSERIRFIVEVDCSAAAHDDAAAGGFDILELPSVVDLAPVFGCAGLQSLSIVGTQAEVEDTARLREVGRLRLLRLQSGVRSLVWDHLFSPCQLE